MKIIITIILTLFVCVENSFALCPTETRCVMFQYDPDDWSYNSVKSWDQNFLVYTGDENSVCLPANTTPVTIPANTAGVLKSQYIRHYYSNDGGENWSPYGAVTVNVMADFSPPITWVATSTPANTPVDGTPCPTVPDPECPNGQLFSEVYAYAVQVCDYDENITWDNVETCVYHCTDCDDNIAAAGNECAAGVKSFDQENCTYQCNDCEDWGAIKNDECADSGGLYNFDCQIKNNELGPDGESWGGGYFNMSYSCKDDKPDTTPPETNTDPPTTPPADDPQPPDDDQSVPWLKAIKGNTDKIISQNDNMYGKISNIDKNLQANVANQGTINSSINAVNDNVKNLGAKLDSVDNSINQADQNAGARHESEKYTGEGPDVPEFDTSLDSNVDYTAHDDPAVSSSSAAQSTIDGITSAPQTTPFNASIDTDNVDACLDGNITIKGVPKSVSICFNKPWMLTGYGIMKLILIGLGYLQTAMLLNRALGG